MTQQHRYVVAAKWTGNLGNGTQTYRSYSRDHEITARGKPPIMASSDAAFRGDATRYNPEDLLVASVSTCHMLWYLHLCADAGIVVSDYSDQAEGTMRENPDGSGYFTEVVLHPRVVVAPGTDLVRAGELHHRAHQMCFVANSVKFEIRCEPRFEFPAAA